MNWKFCQKNQLQYKVAVPKFYVLAHFTPPKCESLWFLCFSKFCFQAALFRKNFFGNKNSPGVFSIENFYNVADFKSNHCFYYLLNSARRNLFKKEDFSSRLVMKKSHLTFPTFVIRISFASLCIRGSMFLISVNAYNFLFHIYYYFQFSWNLDKIVFDLRSTLDDND